MADNIRASNGNGPAVTATVTSERPVGSMTIIVDSVQNWPHKGIATSGVPVYDTLGNLTHLVDTTVFEYHLDGSIIEIEAFSPGYTDIGNQPDELVILKPTTAWADTVAEAIDEATLSEISEAEIDTGTASTLKAITGRRVKYIIDKAVAAVQGLTNWITSSMLQNNIITTSKLDLNNLMLPAENVDFTAWQSWTPSFTNFTLGNGTINYARYSKIGSTVHFRIRVTLGSTSSVTGRIAISLPTTSHTSYGTGTGAFVDVTAMYRDISASKSYTGSSIFETTSSIGLGLPITEASGSASPTVFGSTAPTTPFAWGSGDIISVQGTYEAAV